MSIHSMYLVSDLEGSDNGDPLRDYVLPLAVIHGLVTVSTWLRFFIHPLYQPNNCSSSLLIAHALNTSNRAAAWASGHASVNQGVAISTGSTLGVYSFGLIFVSARTNKRHHHHQGLRPWIAVDSQLRQYIIQLMGSPLSLPSRSDTRYSECVDIVYIHIQGVLILSSDL